ncbi:Isy1-like splicing factor [Astrocystis sublimbata]|nr:Isy1-like splicing factor [Astrocystis sublimbata]
MARNSEKAQSMLFRFREAQAADLGIIDAGRTRRPRLREWRGQVLKEISRKVSKIQDPALSDYQIRDLNDEINKLMREKHMWEVQIRNLGGPNYMRGAAKIYDETGERYRVVERKGKGISTLVGRGSCLVSRSCLRQRSRHERSRTRKPLETRDDLRKAVDAKYYGYAPDEEDDALMEYEATKEKDAFEALLKQADGAKGSKPPPDWEPLPGDTGDGRGWELPTVDEVQQELIARRQRKLLEQFQ